jgi:NAD(P)-dependent dehydrogenase (short-subunit alcohol dehydrogenase family)
MNLTGRTALVTGAGKGIGRAIAYTLSESGARVLLAGRDSEALVSAASSLPTPDNSRQAVCDVGDADAVAALAKEFAEEDISVVVNNAGVPGPVRALTDIEPDEWDDVFRVNVRGVYLVCRAFLPAMIARSYGDIINIASVSGKRPLAGRTPYCSSKMAVIGLTTTLAAEVGRFGIRVNTLSPGPVRGPRMERVLQAEAERSSTNYAQAEREFVSRSAMGRMVDEEEVGRAVLAMLAMTGLCGADIDLSAGMVAR